MKKVLVTGGSGFVGRHLIRGLLDRYPEIEVTSLSRDESQIAELQTFCPNSRLRTLMADIRDPDEMRCLLRGKDTVIHLAAMKRVDLCEAECRWSVEVNILGTMNVLDFFQGETFILMSTDKAVEPVNCYGATKLIAERLVLEQAAKLEPGSGRRFMIFRSGNILQSSGSVIEIWRRQIENYNEITVTDPNMMRYYVPVDGIIRLYYAMLEYGENGKTYYTPHGEAKPLRSLLAEVLALYGNEQTKIRYTGLRPGERMQEKMCSEMETNTVAGFEERIPESAVATHRAVTVSP